MFTTARRLNWEFPLAFHCTFLAQLIFYRLRAGLSCSMFWQALELSLL
jgi:hypothetical protein